MQEFSPSFCRNILLCVDIPGNANEMETTNTVRMSLMQGAFRTDTTLSAWRNYLSNSFVHDFNRWMSLNTHTRRDIRFSQIHLLGKQSVNIINELVMSRLQWWR